MRAENQQRILKMVWNDGDYDVAQEITEELFQIINKDGNPAFNYLESLPQAVEQVMITTEGVFMLVPSDDPAKRSIDWHWVWEFKSIPYEPTSRSKFPLLFSSIS